MPIKHPILAAAACCGALFAVNANILTFTNFLKWRERLGIEPNRLITIFEFREKCDHYGSIIHSYYRKSTNKKPRYLAGLVR
jgi:hypothetical protein